MTRSRRARPTPSITLPAYAGPAIRLNYDLVRPMLVHADDSAIADVIVAYDAAL